MIERYSHEKHYCKISKWLKGHGMQAPEPEDFCDFGFVVGDFVAGFLFKTNSKTAHFDDFVSNPNAVDGKKKRAAFEKLIAELEKEAMKRGYKYIRTLANKKSMISLFEGADYVGTEEYKLFCKRLGE